MSGRWFSFVARVAVVLLAFVVVPGPSAVDAAAVPAFSSSDDWLAIVNHYRAASDLPLVSENAVWSRGATWHSCWMLENGIAHAETVGTPLYTDEGNAAGSSGNVATSTAFVTSAKDAINLWMTGPFHAIGMLRNGWKTTAFGECHSTNGARRRSGATLDVIRGIDFGVKRLAPVLFPGRGATVALDRFVTESPDPKPMCGYPAAQTVGLPILALMPEVPRGAVASLSGPNGVVSVCTLTGASPSVTGTAKAILDGDNAVVVMPSAPLSPGMYSATVTTAFRKVSWSFKVDPSFSVPPAVLPSTSASASPGLFNPITPVRVVDSSSGLGGVSRLAANTPLAFQVSGGAVPAGSSVAVTVSVSGAPSAGWLALSPCAGPTATSTVNFSAMSAASNSAVVALASGGRLCATSSVPVDFAVDVFGVFSSTGSALVSQAPQRLLDTRTSSGRLAAGVVREVKVAGLAGVPVGASGALLNVVAVAPSAAGSVTVFPCGARPSATAASYAAGVTKAVLLHAALSSSGSLCVFSTASADLVVDVQGAYGVSGLSTVPVYPIRLVDTRVRTPSLLNNQTAGQGLYAGYVREFAFPANRGVPAAKAISVNVTAVGAAAAGFVTVYSCGVRPSASSLNFVAGAASANSATVTLKDGGWGLLTFCVFSSQNVHVVVDLTAVHN